MSFEKKNNERRVGLKISKTFFMKPQNSDNVELVQRQMAIKTDPQRMNADIKGGIAEKLRRYECFFFFFFFGKWRREEWHFHIKIT